MYRGFCLALIVALALCGCPKKDTPPETQTVEVQPSPAQPADSNAASPPGDSKHPVVTTAQEFLDALAAGKYNRALSLTMPGEITEQSLKGLHEAFQWDQATFTQVWADTEQAAVIMNSVPAKQASVTVTWALNLVALEDGRWLVRLTDLLQSQQIVDDYLAAFHEVAPNAKSVEP
jgi:hypothetical protein